MPEVIPTVPRLGSPPGTKYFIRPASAPFAHHGPHGPGGRLPDLLPPAGQHGYRRSHVGAGAGHAESRDSPGPAPNRAPGIQRTWPVQRLREANPAKRLKALPRGRHLHRVPAPAGGGRKLMEWLEFATESSRP